MKLHCTIPLLFTIFVVDNLMGCHTYKRRALLNSSFLSNSRKIGYGVGRGATTLTLRIYTIPRGNAIYLASVGGCCLSTP